MHTAAPRTVDTPTLVFQIDPPAGRELRPGMEREIALNVLSQLGETG